MVNILGKDLNYIDEQVSYYMNKYVVEKEDEILIQKDFLKLHDAIRTRVIIESIGLFKGSKVNIEKVHIDNAIKLSHSSHGSQIELKDDIIVINDYDNIIIKRKHKVKDLSKKRNSKDYLLIDKYNKKYNFKNKIIKVEKYIPKEIKDKTKEEIFYFDLDKIKGDITVSLRSPGDKIKPFGMMGYKKINRIFIDKKVSRYKRDSLLVFKDDRTNEIIYIENLVISEDFKVDKNTNNIISIKVSEEEINDKR